MLLLGKRVFILSLVKYMFVCVLAGFSTMSFADELDFLAYGDMRGYLEPCGCDPATDLGGILRINSQVTRERLNFPQLLSLNLGNNLSDKKRDLIKNKYLLQGEEINRPTAYLVNELELQNLDMLKSTKLPLVLSNARTKMVGSSTIETATVIVFGYTWADSINAGLNRISTKLLQDWKTRLQKSPDKKSILLFSGPDQDLKTIADAKLFTTIVSSNRRPLAEVPGKDESENEKLLLRLQLPQVYMVPLGGQGILRSGRLTASEAKTIDDIFKAPTKNCSQQNGMTVIDAVGNCKDEKKILGIDFSRVTWLKKPTQSGHGLADFYLAFNKEVAAQFKADGLSRVAALQNSSFAGDAACSQCHADTHKTQSLSQHAKAMQTLVDKGKHEDPECVVCHSLGSDKEGGFVSIKDSPQFANVQCENCHGPRKEHTLNPSVKPPATAPMAVCVSCHNRQHSPNFNLEAYWEKIKHDSVMSSVKP
jgi:hypothetical protein